MSTSPTRGAVDLSPNAVTVLEKRYLIKDESGQPAEQPEDLFWRVATTVAAPDAKYGAPQGAVTELARAFYDLMAQAGLHAQLAHAHERRPAAGPALGLLRPAGRRHPLQWRERHLRHPPRHGAGAPVGRRHRLLASRASGPRTTSSAPPWAWRRVRSRSCRCTTPRPTSSSRAAPAAAPTWASCGSIIPTSSISSPARTTSPRSPTSTSRWRSPTRSCRRSPTDGEYDLVDPRTQPVTGQLAGAR